MQTRTVFPDSKVPPAHPVLLYGAGRKYNRVMEFLSDSLV